MIGETDRAHALCHKLLSFGGKLLLYAEEIDTTTGEHLGNFPPLTHLAPDRGGIAAHRIQASG
jgi:alpha,alpha-trehalase